MRMVLLTSLCVATAACVVAEDSWPQFRGPKSLGTAESKELPDSWSTNHNVAWQAEIPGSGWSSPIVADSKVFVTAVRNEGTQEPPKKGLYFGGERPTPSKDVHHWMVYGIDL